MTAIKNNLDDPPAHHSPLVRDYEKRNKNFTALGLIAFAIAYFLLAKFGMSVFALKPSNITLLWLPSGLALVMCLQWGWTALPAIFIASFAANIEGLGGLAQPTAIIHTAISASVDASAGIIAATFYKRWLPQGLSKTQDLLPFTIFVCLITTGITSSLLAANMVMGGYIASADALSFIRMLVMADSLGILLIFPIYQGWIISRSYSNKSWPWVTLSAIALALVFMGIYSGINYAAYFVLPILLMLSFNMGLLTMSLVLAASMTSLTALTAAGFGPFITDTEQETNLRLMAFLFSSALTIIGIALQNRQLQISEILAESLRDDAKTDSLTGLFNRRAFFGVIEQEVDALKAKAQPDYAVAMLDLDQFKNINDSFGHAAGDLVLKKFSETLTKHCAEMDIPVRLGGEEFAIFFPNCSKEKALKTTEQLRQAIANQTVLFNDQKMQVTVSIGIATPNNTTESFNEVMLRADKALYEAKASGRNATIAK